MARRVANLLALAAAAAAAAAKCEVLRSLEFQQHTAPKGVSELLGPVVSLVSEKAEVGDIKIRWDGELGLHRVGTHKIVAENSDGACFETIINVKDTDECTVHGAWAHKCDSTATCRNLVGSYACECSPDYFAAEGALFGCGGFASTTQCCDADEDKAACLAAFRCEPDRCSEVCAPTATCTRSVVDLDDRPGRKAARYACSCPAGQLGTGRRSGANSGCARVDACAKVTCPSKSSCVINDGKASCQCDKGYTKVNDACVDETLPTLKLKGSPYRGGVLLQFRLRPIGATVARQIPVLKVTRSNRVSVTGYVGRRRRRRYTHRHVTFDQCGPGYVEQGVLVGDKNSEAAERELSIKYSEPKTFPFSHRAAKEGPSFSVGRYEVAYAIETPWTHPSRVTATRSVTVVDVDECKLTSGRCAHRCAAEARCFNEIGIGYACACPKGTKGDGFLKGVPPGIAPVGYVNGSGCVDATPPTVTLVRAKHTITLVRGTNASLEIVDLAETGGLCGLHASKVCATAQDARGDSLPVSISVRDVGTDRYAVTYEAVDKFGNVGSALLEVSIKWVSLREFMLAAAAPPSCPACPKTRTTTTRAPPTCAADADLLAEIERLRERATTYGLVAAVAVALALITVIVASNAQTASAATARANTPIKVVSYQSLAPEQVEKAAYRSPFDSPTI